MPGELLAVVGQSVGGHNNAGDGRVGELGILDEIGELFVVVHGRHEGSSPSGRGGGCVAHEVGLERSICAVWVCHTALYWNGKRPNVESNECREGDHRV